NGRCHHPGEPLVAAGMELVAARGFRLPGLNGAAAQNYDFGNIAAQAGIPLEELLRLPEEAHTLPGK
ncbi:MAG: hypothetical protein D3906_13055, partial [Candidatus Electrothrix sp. AUS1_2]|nr:hypothetical protein [Candidatus Electrothrix sp. AUS1_2]